MKVGKRIGGEESLFIAVDEVSLLVCTSLITSLITVSCIGSLLVFLYIGEIVCNFIHLVLWFGRQTLWRFCC